MTRSIAIVGGGPAGLMAAEAALAAGCKVDLYERMGSVGRKFLLAGKGGLNLTHSEPFEHFVMRYRERAVDVERWLREFDADALRKWALGLGVQTFVGTSGRVFPADLKAAPLLRGWVRRLRAQGLRMHVHQRLKGIRPRDGGLELEFDDGTTVASDAAVLALGGGSWPALGSDGAWLHWMRNMGIETCPLKPSNGGFECAWSPRLRERFAGQPVKPVVMRWLDKAGRIHARQGEFVLTERGVEGSLIYAASADLREEIYREGHADVLLDLAPGIELEELTQALAAPRGRRSISEHLRRSAQLEGARVGLLFEYATPAQRADPRTLAPLIKGLRMRMLRPRPLAEAISSAGGVRIEALDDELMLHKRPGLFCAGEMLDWEAPTGGYLLTACFASGLIAGRAAARWTSRPRNLAP